MIQGSKFELCYNLINNSEFFCIQVNFFNKNISNCQFTNIHYLKSNFGTQFYTSNITLTFIFKWWIISRNNFSCCYIYIIKSLNKLKKNEKKYSPCLITCPFLFFIMRIDQFLTKYYGLSLNHLKKVKITY